MDVRSAAESHGIDSLRDVEGVTHRARQAALAERLDAVKFLVAALQVGSHLKATHSSKSFVGASKPADIRIHWACAHLDLRRVEAAPR